MLQALPRFELKPVLQASVPRSFPAIHDSAVERKIMVLSLKTPQRQNLERHDNSAKAGSKYKQGAFLYIVRRMCTYQSTVQQNPARCATRYLGRKMCANRYVPAPHFVPPPFPSLYYLWTFRLGPPPHNARYNKHASNAL